jgi:hypothetical protein
VKAARAYFEGLQQSCDSACKQRDYSWRKGMSPDKVDFRHRSSWRMTASPSLRATDLRNFKGTTQNLPPIHSEFIALCSNNWRCSGGGKKGVVMEVEERSIGAGNT